MICAKPQGIPLQLMDKHIQRMKETSVHALNITLLFTPQGLANLSEAKTGPDTEVNAEQSSW